MTDQLDMIYLKFFLYFGLYQNQLAYLDYCFCYLFYSHLLAQNSGIISEMIAKRNKGRNCEFKVALPTVFL